VVLQGTLLRSTGKEERKKIGREGARAGKEDWAVSWVSSLPASVNLDDTGGEMKEKIYFSMATLLPGRGARGDLIGVVRHGYQIIKDPR